MILKPFNQSLQKEKSNSYIFLHTSRRETGTGKELFAQSIHNESQRSTKPFISQNCAAIPDTLMESLLFGTNRGAFTGAIDKSGLFEEANGGTLLLDEINSLSPALQAKLLRAIQEKQYEESEAHTKKKLMFVL